MPCPTVRTLTLNPSIDQSSDTPRVEPTVKLRMTNSRIDAGGGGVNVARILHRLGTSVEAVYLAGGTNGHVLDRILERMGLDHVSVPIDGDSRMSLTIHETETGREYRFVPEGPEVSSEEVDACVAAATDCASQWFVASGSLPRGVDEDFYARLGGRLPSGIRYVLDTSGPALGKALEVGGIHLIKASGDEFAEASGRTFAGPFEIVAEARRWIAEGRARLVAVSRGANGAILATPDGAWISGAADVEVQSTVGAGDSFLAGMVYALVEDMGPAEALRWGTAAGAATTISPGTGLASAADIRRIAAELAPPRALTDA